MLHRRPSPAGRVRSAQPGVLAPRSLALQLGAGRSVIGAVILAAPVPSARLLGVDTATAQRVAWLTRMMGARDAVLGVGALDALRRDADTPAWLVGGAVADAVDAVVVASALRQGRLRGVLPAGMVFVAAGSAALHAVTALRLRRR